MAISKSCIESFSTCNYSVIRPYAPFFKRAIGKTVSVFSATLLKRPEAINLAYNNRASAYNGKEQLDQAISDFNKALEIKAEIRGCLQ